MSDDDLLSHGQSAISSAHFRFTVLFGMGRGGTEVLWSSDVTCYLPNGAGKPKEEEVLGCDVSRVVVLLLPLQTTDNCHLATVEQGYRIKPHGQLVLVSLTHYCASTPSLSTSWSWTTLQGAQGPGRSNLETSFPLRCFQRLSLPNLATRRCHWRDNRYTRDASTPVLSY